MAKKTKKQQDDQFVELPEDRIDQIDKAEPQGKAEKKARRKSSTPRKAKQAKVSNEAPEKAPDQKKQQSDQFVEIPEDRLDQIDMAEPQAETEKKARRKPSTPRKTKQTQASKDAPEKEPEKTKPSKEDLLADIRQTLVSEEDVVEQKGFFGRFKDRLKNISKAKTKEVESQAQLEGAIEAQGDLQELAIKPKPKKQRRSSSEREEKAVQEFFSDLEALADVVLVENVPAPVEGQEIQPEEQKLDEKIQLPKLPVKTDDKAEIDFEKVREVALQEYDSTQVEPAFVQKISMQEEVRKTIRESKPFERILIIVVVALTAAVLLFSGIFIVVKSISFPTPEPTVVVDLNSMVYPTRLSLPGGWEFNLGQGSVDGGEWSPQGAEWLIGTEISRWVALPWSLQLEAVLRTLKSDDQIELTMSNFDNLVYNVYSIQEMTIGEMQALDAKTPSLLVVLFEGEDNSDAHWVVIALP